MKFLFSLSFIFFCFTAFSQNILLTKKVAKIGNEIILKRDVEKYSKLYNISFEEAKKELINESLLYQGAKLYSYPPEEKEIESQIKDDKAYYASKIGREASSISDDEFLGALLTNNVSMKTYREYVTKSIWISKFISETYEKEKLKGYYPTEKEIKDFINDNPKLFEEKEGVVISMIYFSYYTKEGLIKSKDLQKAQRVKAEECLKQIDEDDKFIEMVTKYSDDLFSLNSIPKGRAGAIRFDDPKAVSTLSEEILQNLKENQIGTIKKIFETKHGLYIFKIDEKIQAKKLNKEESVLKSQSFLQKKHEENLKNKIRERLIKEIKNQIEVILY